VGTVAEASAGSGVVFEALWQTQFNLSLGDRAVDQCTSCRIHISRLLEFRGRQAHRSCSVFAWWDPKRAPIMRWCTLSSRINLGNLGYALTARNFNPVIAMAADTVIACVDTSSRSVSLRPTTS